jgi:hypothetical protein
MIGWLPSGWRRPLIDSVYRAEDERGMRIYLGVLWASALLAAFILSGFTPWNWPAEREGRVETMQTVSCESILGDDAAAAAAANTSTRAANKSRAKAPAPANRTACRQLLSDAERAQLGRVEETVAYLRGGGTTPPALGIPADTALRSWVDSNICRLGGADGEDRGALAWHVGEGIGECGGWTARAAQFPLSIWFGWWLGMLLTPILILGLIFLLARHTLRLPSTRKAYRLLYGSEHKAP